MSTDRASWRRDPTGRHHERVECRHKLPPHHANGRGHDTEGLEPPMHPQLTAQIPLRARDGSVRAYAVIDADDEALVNQWRWHLHSGGYAVRNVNLGADQYIKICLHRLLLGLVDGDGLQVDHINVDKLDNRRSNLRVVTHAQNMQNHPGFGGTSAYRGVSWDKRDRKWRAYANVNGRKRWIGYFADELDAAQAAAAFRSEHMPFSEADRDVLA